MNTSFINKNGTLPRLIYSMVVEYMRKTKGKLITLTYQAVKPTRSLLQNRYYWGVVIKMLAMEAGYIPEVMHQYMKEKFLTIINVKMVDGGNTKYSDSTKELTTKEFDEYIQEIRNWAGEFLSLDIPLPNQTQFNYLGYE